MSAHRTASHDVAQCPRINHQGAPECASPVSCACQELVKTIRPLRTTVRAREYQARASPRIAGADRLAHMHRRLAIEPPRTIAIGVQ